MAKKIISVFACQNCSYQTSKWLGRCPDCGEWNTFIEENATSLKKKEVESSKEIPKKINEIELSKHDRLKSNISEFDRVVGGGLVKGSLTLIGGEPGIGKSTLLTHVAGNISKAVGKDGLVLYVSGEESYSQVADRVKRLGIESENFYIFHETSWQNIKEQIKRLKPEFIIIDSIQTTTSEEIQSPPGTVSQVREVTYELMNSAKGSDLTCMIIGHITKEGNIAGPKILEHMVDTVIYFEGDQLGNYRILRAIKNRFGNTNEVGIFEMGELGLQEVPNPSQYFVDETLEGSFGRSLTCVLEGTRCLFIEIQALVVENNFGNGRRVTQGVDQNRLSMLVAVVEKYFDIPLGMNDIYLNVVGGIKLDSRESDLSILASLISSYKAMPLEENVIFLGEVGLTGEVRSIPKIEQRLKEISQLNYSKVITSHKTAEKFKNQFSLEIIGIKKANEIDDFFN